MSHRAVESHSKRLIDIAGALPLILLTSPLLLLVMLLIRASSRGPAIYRSRRRGLGGQEFDCLKLRTMTIGAEKNGEELMDRNEAGGTPFKIRDDPRVTRLGKMLRRLSIDELPQLINVLRGEMSLVGPRPLPVRDLSLLSEKERRRYLVRPGLTGLWQVSGRSELSAEEMIRYDLEYVDDWSLRLDLALLLRTVPVVLSTRGAY